MEEFVTLYGNGNEECNMKGLWFEDGVVSTDHKTIIFPNTSPIYSKLIAYTDDIFIDRDLVRDSIKLKDIMEWVTVNGYPFNGVTILEAMKILGDCEFGLFCLYDFITEELGRVIEKDDESDEEYIKNSVEMIAYNGKAVMIILGLIPDLDEDEEFNDIETVKNALNLTGDDVGGLFDI